MSRKGVAIFALVALALLFLSTPRVLAQTVEGRINGTVTDAAGSVIPGAEVVLKGLDTGFERKTTTSATGTYFMPSIPPGRYSLTVTMQGFQTYVVPDFRLDVNQARTIDAQLSVGVVTQTVEVKAQAIALNTTDATIGSVIQHQQMVELPLSGRNFTQLILLVPGASPVQTGQQGSFTIRPGGVSPAVTAACARR